MLNKRNFEVVTDIMAVDKPPILLGAVKQLDGTTITVSPLNDGEPMNLEGCTAKLFVAKPNEVAVYQEDGVEIDTEESKIIIQCKNSEFSQVGKAKLEVEIYDDSGYVSTTPTFEINVIEKINQLGMNDEIVEAPEIDALEKTRKYIEESRVYIDKFKDLLAEVGEDDNTMLENLLVVRQLVETIDDEVARLEAEIEKAQRVHVELNHKEEERQERFETFDKRIQANTVKSTATEKQVQNQEERLRRIEEKVGSFNIRIVEQN